MFRFNFFDFEFYFLQKRISMKYDFQFRDLFILPILKSESLLNKKQKSETKQKLTEKNRLFCLAKFWKQEENSRIFLKK